MTELVLLGVVQMGKTFALAVWLYMGAWIKAGSLNWWTAPTYSQAEVGFKEIRAHLEPAGALTRATESRLRLDLVNGSRIECRSWEREENLLGPAVDGRIVVDQAELLTGRARAIISSRRAGSLGPMRYGGNAGVHGSEWYRLTRQAEAGRRAHNATIDFIRWTWKDRYLALASESQEDAANYLTFIEGERRDMPADEFARLYESEFLTTGAGVLSLVSCCKNGGDELNPTPLPFFEPWEPDEPCVAGLDLAKERNWSVLSIVGMHTGRLKAMDRFQKMPWEAQGARVVETLKRYSRTLAQAKESRGAKRAQSIALYLDATGIGGPILELLVKMTAAAAIDCIPIVFDNLKKQAMVAAIQVSVEQGSYSMPYIAVAVDEAANLERKSSGVTVRYAAPDGMHDDTVWSIGLALYGRARSFSGVVL